MSMQDVKYRRDEMRNEGDALSQRMADVLTLFTIQPNTVQNENGQQSEPLDLSNPEHRELFEAAVRADFETRICFEPVAEYETSTDVRAYLTGILDSGFFILDE